MASQMGRSKSLPSGLDQRAGSPLTSHHRATPEDSPGPSQHQHQHTFNTHHHHAASTAPSGMVSSTSFSDLDGVHASTTDTEAFSQLTALNEEMDDDLVNALTTPTPLGHLEAFFPDLPQGGGGGRTPTGATHHGGPGLHPASQGHSFGSKKTSRARTGDSCMSVESHLTLDSVGSGFGSEDWPTLHSPHTTGSSPLLNNAGSSSPTALSHPRSDHSPPTGPSTTTPRGLRERPEWNRSTSLPSFRKRKEYSGTQEPQMSTPVLTGEPPNHKRHQRHDSWPRRYSESDASDEDKAHLRYSEPDHFLADDSDEPRQPVPPLLRPSSEPRTASSGRGGGAMLDDADALGGNLHVMGGAGNQPPAHPWFNASAHAHGFGAGGGGSHTTGDASTNAAGSSIGHGELNHATLHAASTSTTTSVANSLLHSSAHPLDCFFDADISGSRVDNPTGLAHRPSISSIPSSEEPEPPELDDPEDDFEDYDSAYSLKVGMDMEHLHLTPHYYHTGSSTPMPDDDASHHEMLDDVFGMKMDEHLGIGMDSLHDLPKHAMEGAGGSSSSTGAGNEDMTEASAYLDDPGRYSEDRDAGGMNETHEGDMVGEGGRGPKGMMSHQHHLSLHHHSLPMHIPHDEEDRHHSPGGDDDDAKDAHHVFQFGDHKDLEFENMLGFIPHDHHDLDHPHVADMFLDEAHGHGGAHPFLHDDITMGFPLDALESDSGKLGHHPSRHAKLGASANGPRTGSLLMGGGGGGGGGGGSGGGGGGSGGTGPSSSSKANKGSSSSNHGHGSGDGGNKLIIKIAKAVVGGGGSPHDSSSGTKGGANARDGDGQGSATDTSSVSSAGSSSSTSKKSRGNYRCSKCGLPKRGHTCPFPSTTPPSRRKSSSSSSSGNSGSSSQQSSSSSSASSSSVQASGSRNSSDSASNSPSYLGKSSTTQQRGTSLDEHPSSKSQSHSGGSGGSGSGGGGSSGGSGGNGNHSSRSNGSRSSKSQGGKNNADDKKAALEANPHLWANNFEPWSSPDSPSSSGSKLGDKGNPTNGLSPAGPKSRGSGDSKHGGVKGSGLKTALDVPGAIKINVLTGNVLAPGSLGVAPPVGATPHGMLGAAGVNPSQANHQPFPPFVALNPSTGSAEGGTGNGMSMLPGTSPGSSFFPHLMQPNANLGQSLPSLVPPFGMDLHGMPNGQQLGNPLSSALLSTPAGTTASGPVLGGSGSDAGAGGTAGRKSVNKKGPATNDVPLDLQMPFPLVGADNTMNAAHAAVAPLSSFNANSSLSRSDAMDVSSTTKAEPPHSSSSPGPGLFAFTTTTAPPTTLTEASATSASTTAVTSTMGGATTVVSTSTPPMSGATTATNPSAMGLNMGMNSVGFNMNMGLSPFQLQLQGQATPGGFSFPNGTGSGTATNPFLSSSLDSLNYLRNPFGVPLGSLADLPSAGPMQNLGTSSSLDSLSMGGSVGLQGTPASPNVPPGVGVAAESKHPGRPSATDGNPEQKSTDVSQSTAASTTTATTSSTGSAESSLSTFPGASLPSYIGATTANTPITSLPNSGMQSLNSSAPLPIGSLGLMMNPGTLNTLPLADQQQLLNASGLNPANANAVQVQPNGSLNAAALAHLFYPMTVGISRRKKRPASTSFPSPEAVNFSTFPPPFPPTAQPTQADLPAL